MLDKITTIDTRNYPNILYPGINWKEGDIRISQLQSILDAKIINSYMNTGISDGAIQVYLAWKYIETSKNALITDIDKGVYNIAFAYSGGTRTLVTKLKSKCIKTNYVVLAAPALIEQDELKELILNYGVKNVIVIQSKDDILNLLYATLEQKHKYYNKKISPACDILIDNLPLNRILGIPLYAENIFLNHPKLINNFLFQLFLKRKYGFTMEVSKNNGFHYASFDITFFLSTCGQKTSMLPLKESFWIGGSNRKKSFEFVNWSKNADDNYDIIVCDILPNKSINNEVVENPVHLHSRLRDVMVEMFSNEVYPFDGTIEGLSKNYQQFVLQ